MLNTTINLTLTSECLCEEYNETTDTMELSDTCYGCYSENVDYANELIEDWTDAEYIDVEYTGKGWTRQAGTAWTTPENIIKGLELNGEFTITLTFTPDTITATRTSHDETGATYTFTPSTNNYNGEN